MTISLYGLCMFQYGFNFFYVYFSHDIKHSIKLVKINIFNYMDKQSFYREQAEKFWDFRRKFRNGDLLSIFEKWAESKDFCDEDKQGIREIINK